MFCRSSGIEIDAHALDVGASTHLNCYIRLSLSLLKVLYFMIMGIIHVVQRLRNFSVVVNGSGLQPHPTILNLHILIIIIISLPVSRIGIHHLSLMLATRLHQRYPLLLVINLLIWDTRPVLIILSFL